jgi:hypothetical protein
VSGGLSLVPDAEAFKILEGDYKKMADDGILLDDAESFDDLINGAPIRKSARIASDRPRLNTHG